MTEGPRRLLNALSKIFGRVPRGAASFGTSEPPPQERPRPVAEGWPLPDGDVTQARWKGNNAVVWWPLKDQVITLSVQRVSPEFVLCAQGDALYEFFTPALRKFIDTDDIKLKFSMANRGVLHVEVEAYRIRFAEFRTLSADGAPGEAAT